MQDDGQQPARSAFCPNCGVPNPAYAVHCSACGVRLPDHEESGEATIVDVSSSQPRVLDEEQPGGPVSGHVQDGFTTIRIDRGRVIVSRSNRRACLLAAIVTVLLICFVCWILWSVLTRLL